MATEDKITFTKTSPMPGRILYFFYLEYEKACTEYDKIAKAGIGNFLFAGLVFF